MKTLTGAERIFTTLKHQEPDRVPHFELTIHPSVIEKIRPNFTYFDLIDYLDLDAVMVAEFQVPGYLVETSDSSVSRDRWGVLWQKTSGSVHPLGGPIKSENDLDTWTPLDPDEPWLYETLTDMVKRYKGQKAIISSFQDPFNIANAMRGAEEHYKDFVRNPRLVDHLAVLIRDYYLKYIKNCIEVGADIILISGDYAATKWPMLSRAHFAKHVIPVLKALVDEAKSRGVYVIKHTDGNVLPIIDMIIGTGIDGLHPIDPNAGMDLGEVKGKYGNKITLLGNVDCAHILCWGSLEEVRQEVKRCMRQAASGGGYICMSSNSIHSGVKPENYVEMVKAIHEYGKYPIVV